MDISYKSRKLEKILQDEELIKKNYGAETLKRIVTRLDQLFSAETLQDIAANRGAGLHPLRGNYKGFFSVDITGNVRLIFEPMDGDGLMPSTITAIKIEDIGDPH